MRPLTNVDQRAASELVAILAKVMNRQAHNNGRLVRFVRTAERAISAIHQPGELSTERSV